MVDEATLRRGRPSAHARFGVDAAVLVGDHFYSRCMALLVRDGDLRVMDALAGAMVSMTEAEVFQLEQEARRASCRRPTTSASFARRRRRSCPPAAGSAGWPAGLDADAVEALATYGERLGIAFQIIDDSLDFAADPARLGKAVGHDLREGKRTLPLIVTLDRATPEERR